MHWLFAVTSWRDWREAFGDHGWNLVAIIAALGVLNVLFRTLIRRIIRTALIRAAAARKDADAAAVQQRADTLLGTLQWAVATFLFVLGVMLVLDEIGISVTALIAGLGVVGVAVGLGAQTLVRDLIGGVFILIEDQYRVGDFVEVAGVTGEVVEINPRRTLVRDLHGAVHTVPNGTIGVATNLTQGFSRIATDIRVPHAVDLERAIAEINAACADVYARFPPDFISKPAVQRVQAFVDAGVDIRVAADVRPGRQWALSGEILRAVKERFAHAGLWLGPQAPAQAQRPADADRV